ncbi:hypothetical protein JHK87_014319 [Glycine soja]|nr:hypothetical protein JHK87_014319 [Glycine soja]
MGARRSLLWRGWNLGKTLERESMPSLVGRTRLEPLTLTLDGFRNSSNDRMFVSPLLDYYVRDKVILSFLTLNQICTEWIPLLFIWVCMYS